MNHVRPLVYRPATDQDALAIHSLLERCALPSEDLSHSRPDFTVACDGPLVIGVGGSRMLRSDGHPRAVSRTWYFLTQTAQPFFEHLGYPGQPMTAHWGVPDPAAVEGPHDQKVTAFREALRMLERRIRLFVSLPIDSLNRMALKQKIDDIGNITDVPRK